MGRLKYRASAAGRGGSDERHRRVADAAEPPSGAAARASSIALGFAVIVLAMLPAVLDQTILATALPTIAADLGSVTDVSWVVTAYVIAAAATTPLWGKLGDRHGRKRLLEASLALFLAASALCGLTQDITELIVARSVQGAAAGGLMALAMAAVGDLVSPRERGRYQGYIAAAFAVATVVGPLLGGAIVEGAGWRWVFYLNLPIGLLALAGLRSLLPAVPGHARGRPARPRRRRPAGRRDDGADARLHLGRRALRLGLVADGRPDGRRPGRRRGVRRAASARPPTRWCRSGCCGRRSWRSPAPALFLATAALFAITVFVPLYLQTTTGATPTEAGPAAGAGHARHHALDHARRAQRRPHRALQALPGRRDGADGRGPGAAGRRRRRPVAADDRDRPRRLRPRLRHGRPDPDHRRPERRRPARCWASRRPRPRSSAALGGAVGAALLGAVFAARVGEGTAAEVADAVRIVFLAGAGIAVVALGVVLALREVPLRGPGPVTPAGPPDRERRS